MRVPYQEHPLTSSSTHSTYSSHAIKVRNPLVFLFLPLSSFSSLLSRLSLSHCDPPPVTQVIKSSVTPSPSLSHTLPVYRNAFSAFATIIRTEGVTALYQGVVPSLVGNAVAWGSYFYAYNALKNATSLFLFDTDSAHAVRSTRPNQATALNLLCGVGAGMFTLLLTNPIWVIKLRMQVYQHRTASAAPSSSSTLSPSPSSSSSPPYRGLIHGVTSLLREEGLRGWFRGVIPGLWGTSHGAIQFVSYEEIIHRLRRWEAHRTHGHSSSEHLRRQREQDVQLASHHFAFAGGLSKMIAVVVTYPYQVARSRMQLRSDGHTSSFVELVMRMWAQEGVRGFYRGVWVNVCRVTPSGAVTFLIYENAMKLLR